MSTTQRIITTFNEQVDTEKEYTRSELGKILTRVFDDLKKEGKSVKKSFKKEEYINQTIKREPTAYNLFIKKNMSTLKEEFPDLSRQDLMKKVGEMWKDNKDNSLSKKTKSPPKTSSSIADEILSKRKLKLKGPPNPPPLPSPPKRSSPKKSKSKLTNETLQEAKSKLKHIQKKIKPDDPDYDLEMAFRNLEKK